MNHTKRASGESVYQWLARTDDKSLNEVENLIKSEASKRGFKDVVRTNAVPLFGVKCTKTEKIDGGWVVTPLYKNELYIVGQPGITRLSRAYRVLPDVTRSIIETGVMHEDKHLENQSAAKKTAQQLESGIMRYGKEKFESLSEDEQARFIQDGLCPKMSMLIYQFLLHPAHGKTQRQNRRSLSELRVQFLPEGERQKHNQAG